MSVIIPADDHAEMVAAFVTESEEMLASMEQHLLALEQSPGDSELLHEIFRCAHTIKGSAGCLGFDELTLFAHALEELLYRLRDGQEAVTQEVMTRLLQGVDTLRSLSAAAVGVRTGMATTTAPATATVTGTADPVLHKASLRIGVEKLDSMLDLTGEIAVARGHVRQLIAEEESYERIFDAMRELDRLSFDLQELVMGARLVPLGPALRPFQRVVRDVAAAREKRASLVLETGEVEVDMTVIEHLKDPITHMLRNAVDHGVESPEERVARGKSPSGTIRIAAAHEQGGIVIRVSDDGRGLDASIGANLDVIFEPGFTTASEVTDISGRGVGMDVVRRNVEALRGTLSVATTPGAGTTFTIRLPLTLTVIEGFAVAVGPETYVIPIETVVECTMLPADASPDACGVLNVRGAVLPFLRLRDHFSLGDRPPARENVVLVQHDRGRAGIVVDELLGATETVMKPLAGMLRQVPGVAGSSILGNGRVALVLDAREIIRRAAESPSNTN